MNSSFYVLFSTLILVVIVDAASIRDRDMSNFSGNKEKKPFCNAFTGCGKKRSFPALEKESSAELDEVVKRILAEARLWEKLEDKADIVRYLASQMNSQPLWGAKRDKHPYSQDINGEQGSEGEDQ